MLEKTHLRHPLMLHFLFVKRQPFIISGFLDAEEFAVLDDYTACCTTHHSLQPVEGLLGEDDDGWNILLQLFESESEDIIEGEKNAILLRQATKQEIDILVTHFDAGWVASTTLLPADLARVYQVPVFDLKALSWVNYDDSCIHLTHEEHLVTSYSGLQLRVKLKQLYQDAMQVALHLIHDDFGDEYLQLAKRCEDEGKISLIHEMIGSYFGLDASYLPPCMHEHKGAGSSNRGSWKDGKDGKNGKEHAVQHETGDIPGIRESPGKESSSAAKSVLDKDHSPLGSKNEVECDPFHEEYLFFTKNKIFNKVFVRLLSDVDGGRDGVIDPITKYCRLRDGGAWKSGVPEQFLEEWLLQVVDQDASGEQERRAIGIFHHAVKSFNMASQASLERIQRKVKAAIARERNDSAQTQVKPLVKQDAWQGLHPVPPDPTIKALVRWLQDSINKVETQVKELATSCMRQHLAIPELGHIDPFKPVLNKMEGENNSLPDLLHAIARSKEGMDRFLDQFMNAGRFKCDGFLAARQNKTMAG